MRFNTAGEAVYGRSGVFVDGATPAALSGMTVQLPDWLTSNRIAYVDGGTGAGPWTLKRLQLPSTITSLDASGANQLGAGLGIWAAFLWGSGVRTSYALTLASAYLLDVSRDGQMAVIDDANTGAGLTVYDETGTSIFADATLQPYRGSVRVNDGYVAYQSATGWHMIDLSTGEAPRNAQNQPAFRPRIDGVTSVLPLVISSTLYVVEVGTTVTLRYADRGEGWELYPTAVPGIPDAMGLTGHVWAGGCTDGLESASSLVVWDVTVTGSSTISLTTGTIVGGVLTFGASSSVSSLSLPTGPLEGNSLARLPEMPVRHPMTQMQDGKALITRPWANYFQAEAKQSETIGDQVQNTPVPNARVTGYDQVASSGQPTMQATTGATTLNVESADSSVTITLNPSTNTMDLSSAGFGYAPMSTGAEPLEIMSNGAGQVLMVGFNP